MSFNEKTKEKFMMHNEDILVINDYILKIGELKVEVVDLCSEKIKQKSIWNLESYIQLALHRVYDLAVQTTTAWNNETPIVAFLLTRAIYENTAYMYDLSKKILMYYKEDDYNEIHKLILNRLVGNRLTPNSPQIVNVLTVIDAIAKEIPDFKEFYDFISDFCHPNYSGMLGIYGKLDKENAKLCIDKKFGYNEETFDTIVTGLLTGLGIFYTSIKNLIDNMDELNDFFCKHSI